MGLSQFAECTVIFACAIDPAEKFIKEVVSMQAEISTRPDYSVVIPMKNEEGNIHLLLDGLAAACEAGRYEVVMVDDGSTDDTPNVIRAAIADHPWLKLVRHPISGGQSSAVHSGVKAASGAIICTMDGDGQNPPAEVPNLVAPFLAPDCPATLGLVAGQRVKRQDTLSKKLASKFANGLRGYILKDNTRDTGCGLKAFRRDTFLEIPYFNNMHRYLPAMFNAYGWDVAHVDVTHAGRYSGSSNYTNFNRAMVGIYDLIGVGWLIKRRKITKPVEDE